MFSALTTNDRTAAVAAVVVLITGVISLAWAWGILMVLPVLAAIGVLGVVFQASVAPATTLPMTKGTLMLALGAAAALIWVLVALQWSGWIAEHLLTVDAIQFLVGLVAAIAMAFAGWRAYQAERGTAATPPAAPPATPSEPPAA